MNSPAEAFLDLLIAAMTGAAVKGELCQLKTVIDPDGKGVREVRLIIIPEKMDFNWPKEAPLGQAPMN